MVAHMDVPEAPLEQSEHGLVCKGPGWFVVNARDVRWRRSPGMGRSSNFGGDTIFDQLGIGLTVLGPGEPMSMYHWETDEEDFLILSGEATLVIEGQERPLRTWDFVHCPPGTAHVIVGAGDRPAVVIAVGARLEGDQGLHYPVSAPAQKYNAGADAATSSPQEAYARFDRPVERPYR